MNSIRSAYIEIRKKLIKEEDISDSVEIKPEQLDEISKKLAGDYADAASSDASSSLTYANRFKQANNQKGVDQELARHKKRVAGINQAMQKSAGVAKVPATEEEEKEMAVTTGSPGKFGNPQELINSVADFYKKRIEEAKYEGSPADKKHDKMEAKKHGETEKEWEGSAADKKADAEGQKKLDKKDKTKTDTKPKTDDELDDGEKKVAKEDIKFSEKELEYFQKILGND